MLEKEFQYYIDHQKEFVNEHANKFLVIKDQAIVGVYDTKEAAYNQATKRFELGTFLIQQCLPGERSHTQVFHSQVTFNNQNLSIN